jgi:Fe-S cluster assembly protein SufD
MESYLADRGAHVKVTGAYFLRGTEHADYDTTQEHAAPDTTSDLSTSRACWTTRAVACAV